MVRYGAGRALLPGPFQDRKTTRWHRHARRLRLGWHGEKSADPDGLKEGNIPFLARILAVADTFHAMTSDRPYRKAMPVEETLAELRRLAGSQLDPTVVDAFVSAVERGELVVQEHGPKPDGHEADGPLAPRPCGGPGARGLLESLGAPGYS